MSATIFNAKHDNGPSRVFVSPKNGGFIVSILYKKRVGGSWASGTKIVEYDIKHFLCSSLEDAKKEAAEWLKKTFNAEVTLEEDKS